MDTDIQIVDPVFNSLFLNIKLHIADSFPVLKVYSFPLGYDKIGPNIFTNP